MDTVGLEPIEGHGEFRACMRKIEEDEVRRVLTGNSEFIPTSEFMLFNPDETESWRNIAKYIPQMR